MEHTVKRRSRAPFLDYHCATRPCFERPDTSSSQYCHNISRWISQESPSHETKLHARLHHRDPFTSLTNGHLPYLLGSSKNPPSTFLLLPIFTYWSLHITVGDLYWILPCQGKDLIIITCSWVWVLRSPCLQSFASPT